jgi:hypothetical protein
MAVRVERLRCIDTVETGKGRHILDHDWYLARDDVLGENYAWCRCGYKSTRSSSPDHSHASTLRVSQYFASIAVHHTFPIYTREMRFASDISYSDMTAEQLALPSSARVTATTKYGKVVGGRVRNGCQVFLSDFIITLPDGVLISRCPLRYRCASMA